MIDSDSVSVVGKGVYWMRMVSLFAISQSEAKKSFEICSFSTFNDSVWKYFVLSFCRTLCLRSEAASVLQWPIQQSLLKLSRILWNTTEYVFVFQKTMV